MEYKRVLRRLLEEFEKGSQPLHIKGGRGYSLGSAYSQRIPPIYGESEAKRIAREDEKKRRDRKNQLNKELEDEEVEISKAFKEQDVTINELKELIRSILYEKWWSLFICKALSISIIQ